MDKSIHGGGGALTIINFHGIGEPARVLEPGEGPFWLSRDQFCTVLDRIASRPDLHRFAITFDDSNTSDLTIAVPELQKRGLTATFFILTGRFGSQGSLDEAGVKEITASGMEIGSHGIDHLDLTRLNPPELGEELSQSKAALEDICQTPVEALSIPFGHYDARVLRAIRAAGYRTAYNSDGGGAYQVQFLRPRRSLRRDMTMHDFDRILAGEPGLLRRLRRAVTRTVKQLT
ncbi:polysaccharide deacetylase family protein [Devosia sp. YIM 151766]|uniref:polysaccharide deacetylase family protein n=1 Tax=Devosia sp. YIM 151766 TaxID=3017325 RepID=UPI00255C7969|nr:polysaccharide deacetylase family protein [Devosia sp. YIM 151766]WIY54209.1 polysaccharide deacetylase family protein [Devosia sp. YIM 151766]